MATIITNLLICHVVEPLMLCRHVLGRPVGTYYLRNYAYMGLFALALAALTKLETGNFFTNGLVSVGMSAAVLGVAAVVDRAFVRRAAAQAVLAARRGGRQGAGDGRK